ncbi:MAG: SDR family NAD(P)-dependent oxidoreductase, partial [Actinomycetota bacterium]
MTEHGASTTTDEILDGLDLTGRRIVVTGASSGLGEESTRALAAHGADVLMVARDQGKLDAATERVRASVSDARLDHGLCDLSDLSSVRAFTADLVNDGRPIDVLMNNAGVMACPELRTADDFEMQFGTNHLGHFVLTAGLWPLVTAAEAPRVVTLTSAGHTISDVDLDDPNFDTTDYDPWIAYGRAKTANALFA